MNKFIEKLGKQVEGVLASENPENLSDQPLEAIGCILYSDVEVPRAEPRCGGITSGPL